MSITDELREFAPHLDLGKVALAGWKEGLLAIADRIDAEHERECKEQYAIGAEHGIGASIDASMIQTHGYIELPKDADGEYIHIGDKVTCGASVWEVTGFRFTGGFWGICCTIFNDQGGSGTNVYPPSDLHHYHAPTVEDVLREFAEKITDSQIPGVHPTYEEAISEYAAKLQLREVDE